MRKPLPIFGIPKGFTLVELAIVLIIITLLTGGLIMSLSAQQEVSARTETQRRLDEARDILLGFAAANGRLPCPAAPASTGVESATGGGDCTNDWDGFLPAITLGIGPTDTNGYALDAWGNPIRYALTTFTHGACTNQCFAVSDGVKNVWNNASPASISPDLRVCSTATGATNTGTATAACASGTDLTTNAVAVIFSRGKNGAVTPTGTDELANENNDRLFVSHTPTPAGSTNEFDDLVVWLSPNILYNRMIAAGRLP